MPYPKSRDPLQPSLLDRLKDYEPLKRRIEESRERVESLEAEFMRKKDEKGIEAIPDSSLATVRERLSSEQERLEELEQRWSGDRGSSLRELRESIRRDLNWLLNTQSLGTTTKWLLRGQESGRTVDLSEYENVASSVLNYGLPDLVGLTHSDVNLEVFERTLQKAVWDFEPRLLRKSVRVHVDREKHVGQHVISFVIEGDLCVEPLRLYLKTELDLENGSAKIIEQKDLVAG